MPVIPAKRGESFYDEDEEMPQHTPRESNSEGAEGMLSAVIPTAVLKGKPFEVGDSVVLRIDSIQGDQIVVSYADEGGDESPAEVEDEEEMNGNEDMPPKGAPAKMASEAGDMMYD